MAHRHEYRGFHVTRQSLLTAALFAAGTCCAAASGPPRLPSYVSVLPPGVGVPVPDSVLAHIRGKGILSNGEVVAFGVTMSTRWQNAMDDAVNASLTVWMNNSGQVSTHSQITQGSSPLDASAASGVNTVIGTPPAQTVASGVGQSVQVAGRDNRAHNQLEVEANPSANVVSTANLAPLAGRATNTQTCGAGCTATTSVAQNALNVSVQTADGAAQQSIAAGHLLQSIQLRGTGTSVVNRLTLQPEIRQLQKFDTDAADVGLVLHSLAGVR